MWAREGHEVLNAGRGGVVWLGGLGLGCCDAVWRGGVGWCGGVVWGWGGLMGCSGVGVVWGWGGLGLGWSGVVVGWSDWKGLGRLALMVPPCQASEASLRRRWAEAGLGARRRAASDAAHLTKKTPRPKPTQPRPTQLHPTLPNPTQPNPTQPHTPHRPDRFSTQAHNCHATLPPPP